MKMFKKNPSDSVQYPFDFTALLLSGEAISGVQAVSAAPSGDLSFSSVISGSVVNVTVSGGGSGKIYVVSVRISTTGPSEVLTLQAGISVNDPTG